MSFQNLTILGNIGNKEPITFTQSGTAVLKLSVAISEKKAGGEENTQWFNVKIFKGTAETVDKFFNVGDTILLNGKMNFYKYGEEPNIKYGYEMIAFTFSFCGSRKQDNSSQQAGQQQGGFTAPDTNTYAPQGQQGGYQQAPPQQQQSGGFVHNQESDSIPF